VLRRVFGPKRDEVTGEWRKLPTKSLINCAPHVIFLGDKIEKKTMGGACGASTGRRKITEFWWENH
jgi:hypothetical protein